jgi:hypothetical protein
MREEMAFLLDYSNPARIMHTQALEKYFKVKVMVMMITKLLSHQFVFSGSYHYKRSEFEK